MLKSENFRNDPRLQEAKKLISETLLEHQSKFTGPSPATKEHSVSFETLIQEFNELRGNKLWYPYLGSGFGKGTLVELLDGSVKMDFITGIGVHFFGHSDPEIMASAIEAALSDTIMEGNLQQNEDSLELTKLLVNESGLDHCFLTSSGAMANENALKIAFQKNFPARRVLAFDHSFSGRSLGMTQITDKAAYRAGLPPTVPVDFIPFYNPDDKESTEKTLDELHKLLIRFPNDHAIMFYEPIQGEGGFNVGEKTFFRSIAKVLKANHIAILADEVQSFGRTPSLFSFKFFGLEEFVDIVTIGKMSQVCATLFTKEYAPKPGLVSQTFTSSVSAIKAALTILKKLIDPKNGFYGDNGRIIQIQEKFKDHLDRLKEHYPIYGPSYYPWGIGAMVAFTFKEGSKEETLRLASYLYESGLIVFIAGENPMRIRMLPPALTLTDEEIVRAFQIIEEGLKKCT